MKKYELIITEKPAASKKIAEALADKKPVKKIENKVAYYEIIHKGKIIIIVCAVGHLYNLTEKEKSGLKYPVFDLEWKPVADINKNSEFTRSYLELIKKFSKNADNFIIATDYDTEGETIGYNVLRFICGVKDANRMKFSTLTKPDLINAYENKSKHIDLDLAKSGITRHFMDYFWGINLSRALTLAIKNARGSFKIMSSGRVQSPTLALLSYRENEIQKFKPEPYWQIFANIKTKKSLEAIHEKEKFWKEGEAKSIFKKCKNKDAIVLKIIKREYKSKPPVPFNITSLQIESYKLFGFSPKQTLDIAQSLYLAAYISYPRTSSEKYPATIGYKKILTSLKKIKEFKNFAEKLLKNKNLKPNEGKKIDPAHVGIYVTSSVPKSLDKLKPQQKKIYSLIVSRFLAVFGEDALKESLEVKFDINKEIFKVKGGKTLKRGWMEFYEPYVKQKEVLLPDLKENERYDVRDLKIKKDETKPPFRYTQGSIISEMEKRGLGTKATRSGILQTLYDRNYITEKSIEVTSLGNKLIKSLGSYVPELTSEDLTRYFEKEMEQIREKKKKSEEVLDEAKKVLTKILKHFKENELKIGKDLSKAHIETREQESKIGPCPKCKGNLKIMYSKKIKARFIACENYKKCSTIFNIPKNCLIKPTGKICEKCNVPLVLAIRRNRKPQQVCINPECPSKKVKEEKRECPKCNSDLILRKSIYGSFYGCSKFPKCRHIERV